MIRLYLGKEPADISNTRSINLPLAINAFNTYGPGSKQLTNALKNGYQIARPFLYERQYKKCAFCEMLVDDINSPVEHFRPKGAAENKKKTRWYKVTSHYWWMTWTWENLFFSCNRCNYKGSKGNKFPLRTGTQRIQAPVTPCPAAIPAVHYDCSTESALLVNPREDNPFDHLQWALVDRTAHPRNWKWTIVGQDEKGDMTIEVFRLEQRVDLVNSHLQVVREARENIENYLALGSIQDAVNTWERTVSNYIIDASKPFRNAVWWALNDLYSQPEQIRHGFTPPPFPVSYR